MKTKRFLQQFVAVASAVLLMSACTAPEILTPTAPPTPPPPTPAPTPTLGPALAVPEQYKTIQAAIDDAKNGDVIVVSPGLYRGNIDFRGKAIIVRSTKPDDPQAVAATVIDGGGLGPVVSFQNGEPATAMLTGLTLTNGTVGILISNASSPTIQGNTIGHNRPPEVDESSLPKVEGQGVLILGDSSPTIADNLITNNRGSLLGGGIAILGGSPLVTGNTVSANVCMMGGGIGVQDASPVITDNLITDNTTIMGGSWGPGGGIAVSGDSDVQITANTFHANSAVVGGGISILAGAVTVKGNTFEDNTATVQGGAIHALRAATLSLASPDDNTYTGNQPDNVSYGE